MVAAKSLPIVVPKRRPRNEEPVDSGDPASFVLVVEENPYVRRAAVAMLQALGFRAAAAVDAHGARESLDRGRPEIVILDTGTARAQEAAEEVLHLMRHVDPPPRIFLMPCGEIPALPSLEGLRFAILRKPFGLTDLAAALGASASSASSPSDRP